jgi:hypothetical protein
MPNNDYIVDIPTPEEELSISSTPGSSYGLINNNNFNNQTNTQMNRQRVFQKYTVRCKMLWTLLGIALVISGSAIYIGTNHKTTEIIKSNDLGNAFSV